MRPITSNAQDPLPNLPRDERIEKAFLAAMLVGSPTKDSGLRAAIESLQPKDFSGINPRYFVCFAEMVREGIDPDIALAADRLHLEPEQCAYLAELMDGVPKIWNVESYAKVLKEKSALRHLAYITQDVLNDVLTANGNGPEVRARAKELFSAHLREEVEQKRNLVFKSGAELAADTPEKVFWYMLGYIAPGVITEIVGKIKIGKTEFIMHMIRAILSLAWFLGKPTTKTSVVYLSEQPRVSLCQAMRRAGLLGRSDIFVLTYSEVRGEDWPTVAACAVDTCKRENAGVLVVDTLPQFAGLIGDSENNSGDALKAMLPLQKAASEGIAVLISRHERKSGGEVGDSGRGSSAFAGVVDVVVSIRKPEGNSKKTIRLLQALSRFHETPAELLIDLTENGYVSLGEPHEAAVTEARDKILEAVPSAEADAVDIRELAKNTEASRPTLQRAVDEMLKQGELSRIGKGKRGDPFRYFLPKKPFCSTSFIEGQKQNESDSDFWAGTGAGAKTVPETDTSSASDVPK